MQTESDTRRQTEGSTSLWLLLKLQASAYLICVKDWIWRCSQKYDICLLTPQPLLFLSHLQTGSVNQRLQCNTIASFPGMPVEKVELQMWLEDAFSVPAG